MFSTGGNINTAAEPPLQNCSHALAKTVASVIHCTIRFVAAGGAAGGPALANKASFIDEMSARSGYLQQVAVDAER